MMRYACCDCTSEFGYIITPAVPEWRDGGGDGSPHWQTNEYDFALDAFEFQNGVQTCDNMVTAEPSVPVFRRDLEAPLKVGSYIVFSGTPVDDVQRVTFNIGVGEDVAVHVDARLPQRCVVRNARRRGAWGPQETAAFRPFPFTWGRPFVVEVLVGEDDTLWAVDGLHYCEFKHRNPSPLAAAPAHAAGAVPRWLELIGARDVSIDVNRVEEYPKLAPPWPETTSKSLANNISKPMSKPFSRQTNTAIEILNENRKLIGTEPRRLGGARVWGRAYVVDQRARAVAAGSAVGASARCQRLRALLHSFRVELTAGCQEWPRPDVAFHFELRAYSESYRPRQLVVLNSRSDGVWAEELRQRSAALVPSSLVTVRVVRGGAAWRVYADGGLLAELPFRLPPDGVRAVRLRGDLTPTAVYLAPAAPADQ